MSLNRILLFYISVNSGHQMAAMAIEDAVRILDRSVETLNINYFLYTNPVLAQLVMKTYHGMLKKTPEIWDYLYDNDKVRAKSAKLRELVYKLNTIKIHRLIQWYKPQIVVCTQAFPCVAMAEYNRTHKEHVPIVGVITDYGIHSYWIDNDVDLYVVPTKKTKNRMVKLGISSDRIEIMGVPVSPKFSVPLDRIKIRRNLGIDEDKPIILVMGGSRGMISIDQIVNHLVKLPLSFQVIIVCGTNKNLQKKLQKIKPKSNIGMQVYGYVTNIEELMSVSSVMVTKPGGLTVTEALVKGLPMVIVNPIPGQETKNTEFLTSNNVAIKAVDARDVARRIGDLFTNSSELNTMKERISRLARAQATFDIAKRIIYWDRLRNDSLSNL